jgi:hypothetical protein
MTCRYMRFCSRHSRTCARWGGAWSLPEQGAGPGPGGQSRGAGVGGSGGRLPHRAACPPLRTSYVLPHLLNTSSRSSFASMLDLISSLFSWLATLARSSPPSPPSAQRQEAQLEPRQRRGAWQSRAAAASRAPPLRFAPPVPLAEEQQGSEGRSGGAPMHPCARALRAEQRNGSRTSGTGAAALVEAQPQARRVASIAAARPAGRRSWMLNQP